MFNARALLKLFILSICLVAVLPAGARGQDGIRLGILPVVDTLPLIVGVEEGLFDREGIAVDLVPFQSALERDAAMQAGRLDGYFGDLLNTIMLISSGREVRVVTMVYRTEPQSRMFGIVTAPDSDIKTLDGLKGRKIAISRNTIIEYLLDRILASRNLPPDFVEKQDIKQMPIRLQMLLSGQIPSALLPEPLLTLAEIKGGRVLIDDSDLGICLTVLALRKNLGAMDETLVARFLKAYGAAVEKINQNPVTYEEMLYTKTRFPAPAKGKYRIPPFSPVALPSEKDVAGTVEWLLDKGKINKVLSYGEVVFE